MTDNDIVRAARQLADDLSADIITARDREMHVRLTRHANSALELANALTATHTEPEENRE